MEYRKFGSTSLTVSTIGFGAWAIGGSAKVGNTQIGWGQTDDAVSKQALEAAVAEGINFFDTADFYGLGHSEELIGEVLGNRPELIIATKVGQRAGNDGNIVRDNTKEWILKACEASLKRLKRDYIDYYQFHVADLESLKTGECVEAMELLKEQGKIRFWGHSLFTWNPFPEADYLMERGLGHGFQLVLNLINQKAVPIVEKAGEVGYGIIARMPLQFGLLGGKMLESTRFTEDDHRSQRLTPEIISRTQVILRNEMVPMARQYDTTLSGLALSFILGFPGVSTVIPGIRHAGQVAKNTSGLVKLSAFDHQYLRDLYESHWPPVLDAMEKRG